MTEQKPLILPLIESAVSTWDIAPRTRSGQLGHAYWLSLISGGTKIPSRAAVDPLAMRAFLADVFLAEPAGLAADNDIEFRYRLAGSGLREVMGREITGCTLAEVLPAPQAEIFRRAYRAVLRRNAPLQNNGSSFWDERRIYVRVETLLLPLRTDDGGPGMILGVSAFEE